MIVFGADRATRALLPTAIALLLFGAIVRFAGLGSEPLDHAEASQSVAAWWTVKPAGEQVERLAPRPESALLLGVDAAAFWLADETSDAGARTIPALAGLAAIALALLLRRPAAGMALAILLAVDPWLIAASRRASGAVLATVAALACHLLLMRLRDAAPTAALAPAAIRQWLAWSCAAGLLMVSGVAAWDFLPPIAIAALLSTRGARRLAAPRPQGAAVLGAAGAAALLGATTGLAQWRGPALVSSSLESWLASWTPSAGSRSIVMVAHAGPAVALFELALAALAGWGLWRAWTGRLESASGAGRDEALVLVAWLGWGAAMQLRSSAGAEGWLALELPLVLAATLGLEEAWSLLARRGAGTRRAAIAAVAAVIALGAALAGVRDLPRPARTLPAARRLAADVAVLLELPAPERPRVEVVTGPTVDAILAWYLRDVPIAWVASADDSADDTPRLALVSTDRKREQAAPPEAALRYTLVEDRDTLHLVELR